MGNIDRADWHYAGQGYPAELPPENGGTHIGMYLAWIVQHDLGSAVLRKHAGAALHRLKQRIITGRDLLLGELDEQFFSSLLTKVGKDFTRDYYETEAYLEEYTETLAGDLPTVYHIEDTWENYDRIAEVIDGRYARWQQSELPPPSAHYLAMKEGEDQCYEAILQAARKLPADPAGAVAILQTYLSGEPAPAHRALAERELEIIRTKYRVAG